MLATLINEVGAQPVDVDLVLDDYHLIDDADDDLDDDDIDAAYAWPGWPEARPWLRASLR